MGKSKKKLLLFGDTPVAPTGLGRLHRYLLDGLYKTGEWDITVIGINHDDMSKIGGLIKAEYDRTKFPYTIYAPQFIPNDTWGYSIIKQLLEDGVDLVITSHDIQRVVPMMEDLMRASMTKGTRWINYIPVDRVNLSSKEIPFFTSADANVFITKYAYHRIVDQIDDEDLKAKCFQIYHPVDIDEFSPLGSKEKENARNEFMNERFVEPYFLLGTINRNIHRKDPARLIPIFNDLLSFKDDYRLYIHGPVQDIKINMQEVLINTENIYSITNKKGLTYSDKNYINIQRDVLFSRLYSDGAYSQEDLRKVYGCFDVFLTTSTGEGFGYSTAEAMAMEIPIVAPSNTSFDELLGYGERGYLSPISDIFMTYEWGDSWRELANIKATVDHIQNIRENYSEAKKKARLAREWVIDNLRTEVIIRQWLEIINSL